MSEAFDVRKWREIALAAINEIHSKGNNPIVCGSLWVETLILKSERASIKYKV